MAEPLPPPIYSQTDPDRSSISQAEDDISGDPHILIIPTGDSVNFQKGFLGVEGERATIEGELQIKGTESSIWDKVTMSLRTIETAYELEIELGSFEIVLFSRSLATPAPFPSSFPFAIPLMTDTPQSIQTSHSSLLHRLTATLHPSDTLLPSFSRSLTVHTRRYTSHTHTLLITPETFSLNEPTCVEVEVPRTTFKTGESVPVYVTVPPPMRELVIDQGLRLRNIRAELIRVVKVKRHLDEDGTASDPEVPDELAEEQTPVNNEPASTSIEESAHMASSKAPLSPLFLGPIHRTIIARSGASCRFHASRPVKLRFVLHQASPSGLFQDFPSHLPNGGYEHYDSDAECPSITQLTILHSITFKLVIYISFVDMTTRRERISVISIPVTMLPPPAPLPQVSHEIEVAYQKKHDQPPAKTNRHEDTDHPYYSEGEAGPSILPNIAPPPFEERDAPPPFFSDEAEASTSVRLPTFLESESEIIIPEGDSHLLIHPSSTPTIAGEGSEFGFLPSQQFDGHELLQRVSTPPPTLEMATRDTDLTPLAEPQSAIVLNRPGEMIGEQPPPPPAMDDPSDPPPSIDSDFRSPDMPGQRITTPPPGASPIPHSSSYTSNELPRLPQASPVPPPTEPLSTHGHAPPPYLIPVNHPDHENITRPPPYMD